MIQEGFKLPASPQDGCTVAAAAVPFLRQSSFLCALSLCAWREIELFTFLAFIILCFYVENVLIATKHIRARALFCGEHDTMTSRKDRRRRYCHYAVAVSVKTTPGVLILVLQ